MTAASGGHSGPISLGGVLAIGCAVALACGRGDAPEGTVTTDPAAIDTLTSAEQASFAVDLDRFHEMQGGRLDTVDMIARGDDAAFHVQILNYARDYTAMTYAAWYNGPDPSVMFAADGQLRLVDDLGNEYRGVVIVTNPRFEVEQGTTAVGVYVFRPAVVPEADSLTVFVNDSTPPVIQVGPFGVRHDPPPAGGTGGLRLEPREPGESP